MFDHTIRVDDSGTQAERKVRAPVRNVHNDFTVRSAPQRVRDLLPADEAEQRLKKRYGSINVWRPIRGPVLTAPLAICEYASIADGDLIAAERRYEDRIGGVYHLAYNPNQRWYYFPRMQRDEVVLLKCFDSLTDGTARWTAHGAFNDPESRPARRRARASRSVPCCSTTEAVQGFSRSGGSGLRERKTRYDWRAGAGLPAGLAALDCSLSSTR